MGGKSRVPIGDEPVQEAEPGVYMLVIQLRDLGSRDGRVAGEEQRAPRASVINNGKDGIIALALR